MARIKLSEYKAKSLLVPGYNGVTLRLATLDEDCKQLDDSVAYVIKVDQGIKKRGKQGLLRLNVHKTEAKTACSELAERGFERFVAEPMFAHDESEEQYVSFERTREGIKVTYSKAGGVNVEDNPDSIRVYDIADVPLPKDFVNAITTCMEKEHLSFVEINPIVVRGDTCTLLDAAVLADSAGDFQASWSDDDRVEPHVPSDAELTVAELNNNSPAAFSLRLLNPDGALWLLLSGGGASITIADEASNAGKADLIGNYGEYSGGPSGEETYLYTNAVLRAAFASRAPKKAIIIAGGVANFTDVKKTFTGIIRSLKENLDPLHEHGFKVFVRRGGPNEVEGLAMIEKFLKDNNLFGSVHGSDAVLTTVIHEALEAVDA